MKNILLSNRDISQNNSIYYRLITVNISLIFVFVVASIFSFINGMEGAYWMLAVDLFSVTSSLFCIYILRKNYDMEKIASYLILMLFFVFISILVIKQAAEYSLLWVLLFPMVAIVIKGTKEGFYYTVIYAVISLVYVATFIGETITLNEYIRFFSLSIILITLVYYNQYQMESILSMLSESKAEVEDLNRQVTAESNELKERLELALIGSNDGVWDRDITNNEVYFSPRWKEMLGYEDSELVNDYSLWEELIHPQDYEKTTLAVQDSLNAKTEYYESVHRMKHKDGHWVWVLDRGKAFFNEDGEPIRMSGTHTDITQQRKIEEELKIQKDALNYQAHHDSLTGLPNRVLFNDRLNQAIEKAKRKSINIAVLFIDLDHFKEINDSLGHEVGDEVLKDVSNRLSGILRDEDTLSRLGGDEFTVILENLHRAEDASILARKILNVLSEPIEIKGSTLYVSSSIGISLYPADGKTVSNLLKYADAAMYRAKDEGRNNFQFYSSEMTELAFERVVMETSLRAGIQNEDFRVYYQAQVDGKTNKLIGMEALVRWEHPTIGVVPPSKFISLAESTGLIVELDQFVMKTAMTQLAQWYKKGFEPGVLALNLAMKQLQQKDFIFILDKILQESQCKAEHIELEVTESQIMLNPEEAINILNNISQLGIDLAVDDFGTGYSSLSYLKRLPINKLKIDQSFVQGLPDDEEDAAISRAVIALAKSLNLRIIAEGVETEEQKSFLVENGCEEIQGYFYSKPVPAHEMENILINGFDI